MKRSSMILCLLPLAFVSAERALSQSMTATPDAKSTPTPESAHASYLNSQTSELALWRQKVVDFDARAETSATQSSQAAELQIAAAWSAREKSSVALAAAGSKGWQGAKSAYEGAKSAYEGAKSAYEGAKSDLEAKWAKFDMGRT